MMLYRHFESEMIQDMSSKGVYVQKYRDRHNGKTYLLPVFDKAGFLKAIDKEVPRDVSKWIEVGAAYPMWLGFKYPDRAEAILEAEFESSYKVFSDKIDKALAG